jgi:uncharacterized protein with PQ loop repeat
MLIDVMGMIGSVMLGICGVPQLIKTVKTRKADSISWSFLLLWLAGEIILYIYIACKSPDLVLFFNYGLNIVILSIILKIKLDERKAAHYTENVTRRYHE